MPSRGSQADAQVCRLMPSATKRALPSPSTTLMPPACGDCARLGSHWDTQLGCTWNRLQRGYPGPGAFLPEVLVQTIGRQTGLESAHRLPYAKPMSPVQPQVAYTSTKNTVFEEPSGNEAGMRLAPSVCPCP